MVYFISLFFCEACQKYLLKRPRHHLSYFRQPVENGIFTEKTTLRPCSGTLMMR